MNREAGSNPRRRLLLLVGSVEEGSTIFHQFSCEICRAPALYQASVVLHQDLVRVVVCEQKLPDGSWQDILDVSASFQRPPPVVVTSRMADERLWAEVLNLGGYDVLAKPLERVEVRRTIELAWERGATPEEIPIPDTSIEHSHFAKGSERQEATRVLEFLRRAAVFAVASVFIAGLYAGIRPFQ